MFHTLSKRAICERLLIINKVVSFLLIHFLYNCTMLISLKIKIMNFFKKLAVFSLVANFTLTYASDPKIKLTWGQEYILPKKHFDLGFLGNNEVGYMQIGHLYGKSLSLQKFSPTLKLESEKLIDLRTLPKGYDSELFSEWNGSSYWFYTTWNKKEGKERLFVQNVDLKKGDLSGKSKELIQCPKVTGSLVVTGVYQFHKGNKFKISFAKDSSKMFVYVNYPNASKINAKNYEEYGFWVFDKNMNVIWSKPNVKMPYTENKLSIIDFHGDKDGNFLLLSKVFNDESTKEIVDNAPNFHYEILKFSKDANGRSINFNFDDKYVSQIIIFEDPKFNIVCSGFYANKDKNGKLKANKSKVDGSFILKLNAASDKMEKFQQGFYEIPNEVFREYEKGIAAKKLEKGNEKGEDQSAYNILLRKVIFNEDGSAVLVGEEYYRSVVTHNNGRNITYTYHYYFKDVLVQYIGKDGAQSWVKKVPKNQHGINSTWGLSVRVLPYKGSNYLFFLDDMKNINLPKDKAPVTHIAGWGGVLMAVRLDEVGEMKKTKVFDTREVKNRIDIMNADKVGDGMLIDRTQFGTSPYAAFRPNSPSKICLIKVEE